MLGVPCWGFPITGSFLAIPYRGFLNRDSLSGVCTRESTIWGSLLWALRVRVSVVEVPYLGVPGSGFLNSGYVLDVH